MESFKINDVPIIHKEDHTYPIVTTKIFIKGGSVNEPDEKSGLLNLLQALINKGTRYKDAAKLAFEIESMGGILSTSAHHDYSEITITVASKHFKKAMELLWEIIKHPAFPDTELEKEKNVILAYLKNRKDYIYNVAHDIAIENLYGGHPYGRIVAGKEETVMRISRDDIFNYFKMVYGSPNLIVVTVGDIPTEKLGCELKNYLGDINKVNTPTPTSEIKTSKKEISKKTKFKQAYLLKCFPSPPVKNKDYPVLKLIEAHLGGGMSSALFQKIREDVGFAYEVRSVYSSYVEAAHFLIYMGLDEKNIPEAERRLSGIINEMKKIGIEESRLKMLKRYIRGGYLMAHQRYSSQAGYLGWWELSGKGYQYDEKFLKEIDAVNSEDVIRVSQSCFNENQEVTVKLFPS